jgi:L-lactate dehydrogenase
MKNIKISIIGAGFVGSTSAYAIMMAGLASEIVIVDLNKEKAIAEAMDLSQGAAFVKPVNVVAGDIEDTKNSDIVIITAGIGQKPNETRLQIIQKNHEIYKTLIPSIVKESPESILLVVSNPVDALTYLTYKLSGFPASRVIGSGTVLDTSRLRHNLSRKMNIDARNVHSYVIGEHGDSEIVTWSITNIGGSSLFDYGKEMNIDVSTEYLNQVQEDVRSAAYKIIDRKGYTNYAVGLSIKRIVEAIIRNEHSILTVSCLVDGKYGIDDVYMALPCVINQYGINRILSNPLSSKEIAALQDSANILKSVIDKLDI